MVPTLPLLSCESLVSVKGNPDRKKNVRSSGTSSWEIRSIIKGAYQVLKDSPTHCEDYISITGSTNVLL